ncbi:hypothetical protein H257_18964 [Aphanomyces astaci]|uniref:Crinkler effector protein N-terminal domain-containing protein n=1 Tax=Aphanomyces astaci TaxID=112090 RepID=W4F9H2_APHAT|nr:hypothetical protein H257_18964 [Aphanomyces astaci]ETV64097.1 hypothetical protein H257_18964 [Aphanomyces astaci]|eukprot:XP_009846417.1 hypothetical protein H257_18964 [Aphanomyces astaci]
MLTVTIARNATVLALKKAIVNETKLVNDRFNVDPATLRLYLTRKNSEWLTYNPHVDAILRNDAVKSPPPAPKKIHVLIELPAVGVGNPNAVSNTDKLEELIKLAIY